MFFLRTDGIREYGITRTPASGVMLVVSVVQRRRGSEFSLTFLKNYPVRLQSALSCSQQARRLAHCVWFASGNASSIFPCSRAQAMPAPIRLARC